MKKMPEKQIHVMVQAHVERYGQEAGAKAQQRADALAEAGEHDGAELWQRIADRLGAGNVSLSAKERFGLL